MKRIFVVLSAISLVTLVLTSPAKAQYGGTRDDKSYLTFSGPVSLPGVTLQAGRYLFRFPSRTTTRSVIQVLSGDGTTVYGMFQTTPTWRPAIAHDPEVTFKETAANAPPVIEAVFPAHHRLGFAFQYPNRPTTTATVATK